MPPLPFELEPTSHCHILDSYVAAAATEAFGLPVRKPRRPYISEATFKLIRERGRIIKRYHKLGVRMKLTAVYYCFKYWCGAYWKANYGVVRGFMPAWLPFARE
eukprot:12419346-Karenia_brevis.AAC.1